jgi:lipoyl(octanoyl) transferase
MSSVQAPNVELKFLGVKPYLEVWAAMQQFTAQRGPDTPDEIWVLQHEPVFTQGQAGKPEHVLNAHGIPIVQSDRGGQVTYHGPGQLVVYFLLDVRRRHYGVRSLVDLIERSILRLLQVFALHGELRQGAPGVYVGDAKVAQLGLRIRRGCSLHGLSLNVDMDLSPFAWINPCGYVGLRTTSLRELLPHSGADLFAIVQSQLLAILQEELATQP